MLQPSTVFAGAALLLLVFNLLRSAWQQRRCLAGNIRQLTAGEAQTAAIAGQATAQLQARVEDRVMAAAAWVAPRVGAAAGMVHQQLSGAHPLLVWLTPAEHALRVLSGLGGCQHNRWALPAYIGDTAPHIGSVCAAVSQHMNTTLLPTVLRDAHRWGHSSTVI